MILNGKFVLISMEKRESNGKLYYNANIESEDGKILRVGCDADTANNVSQKYKEYNGLFEIGAYNGNMFMRLKDAALVQK